MKYRFVTITIFAILGSAYLPCLWAGEPQASVNSHDCSLPDPAKVQSQHGDSFDWDHCGPIDLIAFLQKINQTSYTARQPHKGWVKEKDLPGLFALIDSTQPSANVCVVESSFMDPNMSTVGNEAAWMISSFRAGQYPPGLNSTHPKPNRDELKRWWRARIGSSADK